MSEDISVIGYDDEDICRYLIAPMTTSVLACRIAWDLPAHWRGRRAHELGATVRLFAGDLRGVYRHGMHL